MQTQHRITPLGGHVTSGNIHAADIAHTTVDNDDFAVVAVVNFASERRKADRQEGRHFNARLAHLLEESVPHTPTAHVIVYETYLDTLTCLIHQSIGHQTAYGIVLKDIHIDMYVMGGLGNVLQQFGEKGIAVSHDVYLIILERQREILIYEKIDKRFMTLRHMEVVLLNETQH